MFEFLVPAGILVHPSFLITQPTLVLFSTPRPLSGASSLLTLVPAYHHRDPFIMATEQADREPKAGIQESTDAVHADPSREVTKKRQSLSDLFTIVGHITLPYQAMERDKHLIHLMP